MFILRYFNTFLNAILILGNGGNNQGFNCRDQQNSFFITVLIYKDIVSYDFTCSVVVNVSAIKLVAGEALARLWNEPILSWLEII